MIPHPFFYLYVSCYILPGPVHALQPRRDQRSPSCHGAHAPASRNRLPVSPISPSVSRVSRHRRPPWSLSLLRHRHGSPPPVAASARSTPHAISAPIRTVPTGAGWAGGISAPMDFLPFVKPNVSHFLPHLRYWFTTNPAGIIARTMTQHGHQDTQESVTNIA